MTEDGKITRTDAKALIAAWLGWAFDGLDGYLYVLVALPFVRILLEKEHPGVAAADSDVQRKAAIIMAVFLVGWAIGGAFFGRLGDRLGRSRILMLTVLTYAIFTGMAFFATRWWHLLIFRFLAALGIGGEWAAGCALVSETLHHKHRSWASAALQSGYQCGCIAAVLTTGWMAKFEPKYVFLIGVVPAFFTLWIRSAVPEPEEWKKAAAKEKMPSVAELFKPGLASRTLLVLGLTSIALTTVWGLLYFAPQSVRAVPEIIGKEPQEVQALVTRVSIVYLIVNIMANFCGTYFARLVGYRAAFFVYIAGSLASYMIGFRTQPTLSSIYWTTSFAAFFSLGLFGMFPMYIPPLFPTLVRTLGAGFTYNVGRLVAAVGTFYLAQIAAAAGGPSGAIRWVGLLFIPGLVIALFIPVPKFGEEEKK